ncbi:hypothetical protein [Lysinibacillus sp. RS5]
MNDAFYSKHFTLEQISKSIFAAIAKEGSGAVANAGKDACLLFLSV